MRSTHCVFISRTFIENVSVTKKEYHSLIPQKYYSSSKDHSQHELICPTCSVFSFSLILKNSYQELLKLT
jgi:hypothetical protein